MGILDRVLRAGEGKKVKALAAIVPDINALASQMSALSDTDLRNRTNEFKSRLERGQTLEDLLIESFAVVREASTRVIGQRHYDVQLMGGAAMHAGWVAEMKTGEGKTLVSTLPAYLNALSGKGVHLITTNDYLAQRDAEWMGQIHRWLGLSIGLVIAGSRGNPAEKRVDYGCDITYGTNNEFGFDYLRDNMVVELDQMTQRDFSFAIVDEVDSILIDEARTPLIISGAVERTDKNYFSHYKESVERLMRSQNQLINEMLKEAEELLKDPEKEYEAGIKLLQVKRGSPKNKRFLKISKEGSLKKLVDQIELDYIRDKRVSEIDDELYFSIDERSSTIDLSDKGRHQMSPNDPDFFILPDLSMSGDYNDLTEDERFKK
ncbi:MAG: DEAD/DEAH box helicase, partial [Acidimicrobiaceae bacterium]|nr:DEAD/DEAH box helicase [Acidimicrobiaceae bacterium]